MAKLERIEFARQCAFISKNAASWSSDVLFPGMTSTVNPEAVERFCREMEERIGVIRAALKEEEGRG